MNSMWNMQDYAGQSLSSAYKENAYPNFDLKVIRPENKTKWEVDSSPQSSSRDSGCSSPTNVSVRSFDSRGSSGYGSKSSGIYPSYFTSYGSSCGIQDDGSAIKIESKKGAKRQRRVKKKCRESFNYCSMRSDLENNGQEVPLNPEVPSPYQVQRLYSALELLDKYSGNKRELYSDTSSFHTISSGSYAFTEDDLEPTIASKPVNKKKSRKNYKSDSKGLKCNFCVNNGEEVYNHRLKDDQGRTICPVLMKFQCKLCGQSGFNAHTQKFCPLNPITKGKPIETGMPPGLLPESFTFRRPPMQTILQSHTGF